MIFVWMLRTRVPPYIIHVIDKGDISEALRLLVCRHPWWERIAGLVYSVPSTHNNVTCCLGFHFLKHLNATNYNNTKHYIMALTVSVAGLEDIDDTSGIETVWIIHNWFLCFNFHVPVDKCARSAHHNFRQWKHIFFICCFFARFLTRTGGCKTL